MSVNIGGATVLRFSIFFQQGAQVAQIDRNLSGLNPIAGVAYSTQDLFTEMIALGFPALFQPICSPSVSVLGAKLYVHVPGGPPLLDQNVTDFAATCTGAIHDMPSQSCGLIRLHSTIGGSRGAGRIYTPFPNTAAQATTGLLAPAYETLLTAIGAAMITGWVVPNTGLGGGTVTVKACTKYTVGTTPPLPFGMITQSIGGGFATQKRRGFFGKPNNSPF